MNKYTFQSAITLSNYFFHFNSCVLFCLFKDQRVFFGLIDQNMKSNIKKTPKSRPPEIWRFFWTNIKSFEKIFFTGSLTGSESEIHKFDQATEIIWVEITSSYYQFCYVLAVHSKTWICLLKDQKGRIYYSKKEDATVKIHLSAYFLQKWMCQRFRKCLTVYLILNNVHFRCFDRRFVRNSQVLFISIRAIFYNSSRFLGCYTRLDFFNEKLGQNG